MQDIRGTLVFTVLADTTNTVLQETSTDVPPFVCICAAIIIWLFVYLSPKCAGDDRLLPVKVPILLFSVIGAFLYYCGDNIIAPTDMEGESNSQSTAENIILALSLVFHFIPSCLHWLCIIKCNNEVPHTPWTPAFDTITAFIILDTLFTLVTRIPGMENCDNIGSWTILIAFIVLGVIISICLFKPVKKSWYCPHSHSKSDMCCCCKLGTIAFFILLITLPFWLLADNHLFLDCTAPKSNVRLGFAAFSLAGMALVAIFTTAYAIGNIDTRI